MAKLKALIAFGILISLMWFADYAAATPANVRTTIINVNFEKAHTRLSGKVIMHVPDTYHYTLLNMGRVESTNKYDINIEVWHSYRQGLFTKYDEAITPIRS